MLAVDMEIILGDLVGQQHAAPRSSFDHVATVDLQSLLSAELGYVPSLQVVQHATDIDAIPDEHRPRHRCRMHAMAQSLAATTCNDCLLIFNFI